MNNKEKLLIYPFDIGSSPLARHPALLGDYTITALVSPNGWGFSGKDAGRVDSGNPLGIEIGSKFEEKLDDCDTVLFARSEKEIDFQSLVYPKMQMCMDKGKNIICCLDLQKDIYTAMETGCSEKGIYFRYYGRSCDNKMVPEVRDEILLEINTPVIFVFGLTERVHKFEIQLSLREKLQEMGYKLSQIGTRSYCELLGFHSFPEFMYGNSLDEVQKVVAFNKFVKMLEKKENPDLIIIGVPGAIMSFDNTLTNRFGILAYEVSQAVTPDAAVLGTLYEDYRPEYYEKVAESIPHKLGFEIDCFNVANVKFDWDYAKYSKATAYIVVESQLIIEKLKGLSSLKTPAFNILNTDGPDNIANCLVDKLAGFGEAGAI